MPRFKQPIPMKSLAFDSLVRNTVDYCNLLSIRGLLIELRQSIADIKQHVRDYVPGFLFAEFCTQFLNKFYSLGARRPRSQTRPADHQRAALEIMMDMEIAGLACGGHILRYLDPDDAHRLQGLKTLDWTNLQYRGQVPQGLANYHLQDLAEFIAPKICTDHILEIVGSCCFKLEILRIQGSTGVTDEGLRALSPCSELRVINLNHCAVSDVGVNELLSLHKKLEEFNVGDDYQPGEKGFDISSRAISLVCPSVKRFAMKTEQVTNLHFNSVVTLFPNLSHLQFCCPVTGDLGLLRNLDHLTLLEFGYFSDGFKMENLKELLTSVGANILRLILRSNVYVTQKDLNFIFNVCRNVEWLCFGYEPSRNMEILKIPSFQKLKHLECIANVSANDFHAKLELDELPSLERLSVRNFDNIFQLTESMMFDNVNFPNLKEVRTFWDLDEINEPFNLAAKTNNLDFAFLYSE